MNKHTVSDLYQMQSLPLSAKIRMTQYRIREWVDYCGNDGVYISFSGGKDSTVLLHIAREMYRNIKAAYADTGLEYPEVRKFVKQHENLEIIRPQMNFRQIIIKIWIPNDRKRSSCLCIWSKKVFGKIGREGAKCGKRRNHFQLQLYGGFGRHRLPGGQGKCQ